MSDDDGLLEWTIARVAAYTNQEPGEISPDANIASAGLDSVGMVGLSGDLEEKLGRRVDPEWIFEHDTLRKLTSFLGNLR